MAKALDALFMRGVSPGGAGLLWEPGLIWLQAASDAVIGLSAVAIPLAIIHFVRHRQTLAVRGVLWMFAAFIFVCGLAHFVTALTLWYPAYGLEAVLKAASAALSLVTAVMTWPLAMPAVAAPTSAELRYVSSQPTCARPNATRH